MARAVKLLWAAPVSALGLLLSPFFDRRFITRGVLLCEGARWPRRLGWRYRAATLGHVVLAVDELDPATMAHELAPVRQYESWGLLLLPVYLLSSLAAALGGRHHYRDNRFEIAARRATST